VLEETWKKALIDHLARAGTGFRLWHQPAGESIVRARGRTRRIIMAPDGAADLTGTAPLGVRIEVEAKVDEPWKASQRKWARKTHAAGAIYVVLRYVHGLTLQQNLADAELQLCEDYARWIDATRDALCAVQA
jgi:hypothetical protein